MYDKVIPNLTDHQRQSKTSQMITLIKMAYLVKVSTKGEGGGGQK